MKHNLRVVSIICILILFLSGCASTSTITLPYEYPKEKLSASAGSSIAIVYPEDKRTPNEDIDKIWLDDPIKEIDKVVQEEIKSTGLFKEVLPVNKAEIYKSGARMVLYTSVMELKWDIPDQAESGGDTSVSFGLGGGSGGSGGFGSILFGSGNGSTDLYGKAKIKVALVDQDTGQNLLDKEYYSRARKEMSRSNADKYGERAKVIGKALKDVMGQLKVDLKGLFK